MGGIVAIFARSNAPHIKSSAAGVESWKKVKELGVEKIGMAMFMHLYEKDPATFQMFKTFRDDTNWKESKGFKSHSKIVITVIGNAVGNETGESKMKTTLQNIGTAHSLFPIKPLHFDYMKEGMMQKLRASLGESFTEEVEASWSDSFDVFANAMKESLYQNKKHEELVVVPSR
jgi:hemoglobin-like flavoprotein